jgi:hypothetical protein
MVTGTGSPITRLQGSSYIAYKVTIAGTIGDNDMSIMILDKTLMEASRLQDQTEHLVPRYDTTGK